MLARYSNRVWAYYTDYAKEALAGLEGAVPTVVAFPLIVSCLLIPNTIALTHRIHDGPIETGQPTSTVAWGEDGQTLFITGDSSVYRLRLTTGAYQY